MIYRILVDFGWRQFLVPKDQTPEQALSALHHQGLVPNALLHRLGRLSQPCPPARIAADGQCLLTLALWDRASPELRITGASFGALGSLMEDKGLKAPLLRNSRGRFYFTELGWRQVGRHVAARARQMGHVVRVIRRKTPRSSEIIYRDALQVALLPPAPRR